MPNSPKKISAQSANSASFSSSTMEFLNRCSMITFSRSRGAGAMPHVISKPYHSRIRRGKQHFPALLRRVMIHARGKVPTRARVLVKARSAEDLPCGKPRPGKQRAGGGVVVRFLPKTHQLVRRGRYKGVLFQMHRREE